MRIHKRGRVTLLISAAIILLVNSGLREYSENGLLILSIAILSAITYLLLLWQFRLSNREIFTMNNSIVAPIDGIVQDIKTGNMAELGDKSGFKVTINNSFFHVHQSWFPVEGKILVLNSIPGEKNNQAKALTIETAYKEQIALHLAGAKRSIIKVHTHKGNYAEQCDPLGFINWGSKTDIFIPDIFDLKIKKGDRLKGAQTEVARLKVG